MGRLCGDNDADLPIFRGVSELPHLFHYTRKSGAARDNQARLWHGGTTYGVGAPCLHLP